MELVELKRVVYWPNTLSHTFGMVGALEPSGVQCFEEFKSFEGC